jgi:hypothetical protein
MHGLNWSAAAAVLLLAGVVPGSAQARPESEVEVAARLARQSAGLAVGVWRVQDLARTGVTASAWPLIEGHFQRGLDRHLAVESSVGLWRRQETETASGLGGTTTNTRTTYIVPLLTGLRFYPTPPGTRLEPVIGAAVGFALGIEDGAATGGLLGGSSGTRMETGLGVRGAGGVEYALGGAFGVSAGAGYQWFRFGSAVGPTDTYGGVRVTAGLTYRFQY